MHRAVCQKQLSEFPVKQFHSYKAKPCYNIQYTIIHTYVLNGGSTRVRFRAAAKAIPPRKCSIWLPIRPKPTTVKHILQYNTYKTPNKLVPFLLQFVSGNWELNSILKPTATGNVFILEWEVQFYLCIHGTTLCSEKKWVRVIRPTGANALPTGRSMLHLFACDVSN